MFTLNQGVAGTELLKKGAVGENVSTLQNKLIEYGYLTGSADGKFGDATWSAVVDFQLDCGIEADGVVGEKTWNFLKEFKPSNNVSRGSGRYGQQIAAYAKSFLGVPYAWGGKSPAGFDCSGFIFYVYRKFGVSLPRMADEQYGVGTPVKNKASLQLGDLVFFTTYEPGPSVVVTALAKSYYSERFLGGRRILR